MPTAPSETHEPALRAGNRREWWLTGVLCVLLTLFAYHDRLTAYFFQDDLAMIAHGVECWRDGDLFRLFSTDQYDVAGYNRLRPVVLSMFAFLYHAVGLVPIAYRAVNLALFAGSGVLVAWLARRDASPATARLAAVVFLTSPSLTNAVYPVCTLTDVSAGFFVLLATCVMTHAHRRARRSTWLWALPAAGAAYLLAQFSKETGIVSLPLAVLAGRFLAGRSWRTSLLAAAPIGVLTAGYLAWRTAVFSSLVTAERVPLVTPSAKFLIWRYVFFWFENLVGLNLEGVKAAVGPVGIEAVTALIVIASLVVLEALRRFWRVHGSSRGVRFSAAAFACTLAAVGYYPSCRNLYLPLAMLAVGVGGGIAAAFDRWDRRPAARRALASLLVVAALWRFGLISAACRNNGRAGDLFHRIVTQLDVIASRSEAPHPRIEVFAAPAEILRPFLLDTPWVICGGEARHYELLTYGAARADFRYHLFTSLHRLDERSIAVDRPGPDTVSVALGPQAEFHWWESFDTPSRDYGEVTVVSRRTLYRDPVPDKVLVRLAADRMDRGTLLVGFDGVDMRVLSPP
jgi:hypothetical protein